MTRREFVGGAAALAAADAWLGEYGRMVTTRPYYDACRDVIRDAAEMFDHPRYLHIGYDEWIEGFDLAAMKPDARSRPILELYRT